MAMDAFIAAAALAVLMKKCSMKRRVNQLDARHPSMSTPKELWQYSHYRHHSMNISYIDVGKISLINIKWFWSCDL